MTLSKLKFFLPVLFSIAMSVYSAIGTTAFAFFVFTVAEMLEPEWITIASVGFGFSLAGIVVLGIYAEKRKRLENLKLLLLKHKPDQKPLTFGMKMNRWVVQFTTICGTILVILTLFGQKAENNKAKESVLESMEAKIASVDLNISNKQEQIEFYTELGYVNLRVKPREAEVESLTVVRDSLQAIVDERRVLRSQTADLTRGFDVMSALVGLPLTIVLLFMGTILSWSTESGVITGWGIVFDLMLEREDESPTLPQSTPRASRTSSSKKVDRVSSKFKVDLDNPTDTTKRIMYYLSNLDPEEISLRKVAKRVGCNHNQVGKVIKAMEARAAKELKEMGNE